MTFRHLTIFQAVCEAEFNLTKAAQRLHMTQPAVSLAIKELEQYYGVRLFDRLGRRLRITEAGTYLLQGAVHISDLYEHMETGLRDWDSRGVLRVGASITIGARFLPGYVCAFSRQNPDTDVRVVVDQSERLEKKILENELDIALIEGIPHGGNLRSEAYMEDHLAVVCPADGRWQQDQLISLAEFRQQRFLLREPGSGTREVFERVIGQAGFSVTPVWEAMSTTALVNAVISGLGISVLPRRLIRPVADRGLVVTVRVEGLTFRRSFHIIHHKDKYLTAAAKKFLALCRASGGEDGCPAFCDLS